MSDDELIAKYSKLPEIGYFLEKHPDAKADVDRVTYENAIMVSFSVEKQIEPASDFYSGINVLTVSAHGQKLTCVTLGIDCGISQGFTVGVGLADVSGIDAAEEWCFQTLDRNSEILEPDKSSDELNDTVYQFAFMP
ncbi:MAG TPA: hypothetical protein VI338_02525 [Nitrososphaera sp.]|nr:hypothetical protein [Nitrososphaera sp.]